MKLLKNRKFAAAILVVCVLGSIFGFGGKYLAGQRGNVVKIFNDGTDTSAGEHVFSMDAYLDKCADYAAIMAREYKLHGDAQSDALSRVETLASSISDGNDYVARSEAYRQFLTAVDDLYVEFKALGLSADESKAFEDAHTNILEDQADKIKRDGYHAAAESFNAELGSFPAGIVSKLLGIGSMGPF